MARITVDVPLSSKGISATTRALRKIKQEYSVDGDFDEAIRVNAAQLLLDALDDNIAMIVDPDGNTTGTTSLKHITGVSEIRWSGDQILFLEFGTGVTGINDPYPDSTIMSIVSYQPEQYHGIEGNEYWTYHDEITGAYEKTYGVPAYAPMYTVFLDAERILQEGGFKAFVESKVSEIISNAFSKESIPIQVG